MKIIKEILKDLMLLVLIISISGCNQSVIKNESEKEKQEEELVYKYTGVDSVEDIVANMSLEDKAGQMIQGAVYNITDTEMQQYCYGSILSDSGNMDNSYSGWKKLVLDLQKSSLKSKSGIPYIYGTDAVHGNIKCEDAVVFPHNIGIGAANDEELSYRMGQIVAQELKLTGMLWNFSPCVAVAEEPRWGRTYESYSSDPTIVTSLAVAYAKGQLDGGVMPCAKHYLADGNIGYGTGEGTNLVDRGDATLTDEETDKLLAVYGALIDAGVKTVMVSHSSINGVKLHANKELITDVLKNKMGFEGFVVSDWESIHNIPGDNLKEQVITSVNAGIDMLMEPEAYKECYDYIIQGVKEGSITKERVDDAVTRIVAVKKEMGLFEDPMQENLKIEVDKIGTDEYRDVARQLVEKSMVLLKNDGEVLPIKKGTKIFVTGPAVDNAGVQCGGWTVSWQGSSDNGSTKYIKKATTILEGLEAVASDYNLTIITDKAQAQEADLTILCVGEAPYAEWEGDTADMSITGVLGLKGNAEAIEFSKELGKPVVTLIVAGRQVIVEDYIKDWDAVVMCYLPGSEADGVANVLVGKSIFEGKLPMPWYKSIKDIGTDQYSFNIGYGLQY